MNEMRYLIGFQPYYGDGKSVDARRYATWEEVEAHMDTYEPPGPGRFVIFPIGGKCSDEPKMRIHAVKGP